MRLESLLFVSVLISCGGKEDATPEVVVEGIEEPAGAVSLRDVNGHWIDLEFDGEVDGQWPPPDKGCDGCAQGWYQGLDLGQICLEFDGLRDWTGPYPWQ